MNVYSELVSAQLENLASHPTNNVSGRIYFNTTDGKPYYYDSIKSNWEVVTSLVNKIDATVDPTVDNDVTEKYEVGSVWVNTTTDKIFICVDATDGAAVWKCVGLNQKIETVQNVFFNCDSDFCGCHKSTSWYYNISYRNV